MARAIQALLTGAKMSGALYDQCHLSVEHEIVHPGAKTLPHFYFTRKPVRFTPARCPCRVLLRQERSFAFLGSLGEIEDSTVRSSNEAWVASSKYACDDHIIE